MRRVLLGLVLIMLASPAGAENLAQTVSNTQVQITQSFDGTTLSLFGTIEPDVAGTVATGPYDVIVVFTGPLQDRVTRQKTDRFGIWTNTDQVVFRQFPSFYSVSSNGKLDAIASEAILNEYAIGPKDQARVSALGDAPRAQPFGNELVKLMTDEQHFSVNEDGVRFLSGTAYVAQVTLPSDVSNGPFTAHTYVLKDKVLVADGTVGFSVRKTGFESFVFVASKQQPLIYGLVCVMLALGTGWLAGVVFKR